jgi:hypothetical protein
MMGRRSAQEQLFYTFRLEDHIPADHLLRQIDLVLNLGTLQETERNVRLGEASSPKPFVISNI